MKKIFYILLICAVFLGCTNVQAETASRYPGVISLNVSESKETEPDIAKITFAIETTAETAQKAAAENNTVSNKVVNAIKALTNEKDDTLKTSNFSVRPNYSYSKDSTRKIKDYTAYNSVVVQTRDLKKVSKYIDTAITNGANRTDNLTYTFENPNRFCQELYPELMRRLRVQADAIAKASGSSVDGIKYISAGCNSSGGYSGRMFMAAKAVNSQAMDEAVVESTPIESGKIKVNVSVNAEFYVK